MSTLEVEEERPTVNEEIRYFGSGNHPEPTKRCEVVYPGRHGAGLGVGAERVSSPDSGGPWGDLDDPRFVDSEDTETGCPGEPSVYGKQE